MKTNDLQFDAYESQKQASMRMQDACLGKVNFFIDV